MKWTTRSGGTKYVYNGPHNPKPRTPRGKRRHAARDDKARVRAENAWADGYK